jgi:condensation enzyme
MESASHRTGEALNQFPLSFTQEYFCSLDRGESGGAFGHRFILNSALRITGELDIAALQGALDDVIARHEILRSVVIREADTPYQQVYPPCSASLEIREILEAPDRPRNVLAEEFILGVEREPIDPRKIPLLNAVLGKFDERDWVLVLTVHHSASDGWGVQMILHDLAAFYSSRTTGGRPAELPVARQYHEFAAWQRAGLGEPASESALAYWRRKLAGAQVFTMPNDRPTPELHTRPYSAYNYFIDADVISAVSTLAGQTRSSLFMILLAAFNVLACQLSACQPGARQPSACQPSARQPGGPADPAVLVMTNGRSEAQFRDTIGVFLNLVPMHTDVNSCTTFNEVVTHTRDTCVEAYENEVAIHHIEEELPEFSKPNEDPRRTEFVFDMFQPQFNNADMGIGERSREILERELPQLDCPDIPGGMLWALINLPSGQVMGTVVYNMDEIDERTVAEWVSGYQRILSGAATNPDREWKKL